MMGRTKTAVVTAVKNKTCPPCLKEEEVGSVCDLTLLCIQSMLAAVRGSAAGRQGMNRGKDMPDRNSDLLPSFNAAYSVFEQVWLAIGGWNPIPPLAGMQSNSPFSVGCPITNSNKWQLSQV